mmetsp:Transcript_11148/g.16869  ORF Transcript_11148/g.16869 Transcript_11148/m.16869 type:complete len:109 (-) Transcript_11148:937-1263(-)
MKWATANKIRGGNRIFITSESDLTTTLIEVKDTNTVGILVRNNQVLPTAIKFEMPRSVSSCMEVSNCAKLTTQRAVLMDTQDGNRLMASIRDNNKAPRLVDTNPSTSI